MSTSWYPVWAHADGLAVVEGDGRVVAMDLCRPNCPPLGMPGAAADVWRAMNGNRTGEEVVAEVAALWGTAAQRIAADIYGLLDRLAHAGLIVPVPIDTGDLG